MMTACAAAKREEEHAESTPPGVKFSEDPVS